MNIGFALDDDVPCADTARNFACKVDRRGVLAMQIAAQSALYQCGLANDATAPQIAFACQMDVSTRSNRSAETTGDFVVAQVNVRAA